MARAGSETGVTKGPRVRLDRALVDRGLYESRARAQAAILAGLVRVAGRVVDKPGLLIAADAPVEVVGPPHPYASRGGVKLAYALDRFGLDPTDWRVVDIGASTGGFTDCWLQRGARQVIAVDVGHGQLLPRLASDPRVVVRDRLNARYLRLEDVGGQPVDAASIDVSFIGLALIFPAVAGIVKCGGSVVALVKPQFEVGRGQVGKGGVVRDPDQHRRVLEHVTAAAAAAGLGAQGVVPSPIRGAGGNREFLLWLTRGSRPTALALDSVVRQAGVEEATP
jgi:23S rRNA (cytidine1920-2'-O)/16S rRNA (cytidine1409-2'-O)-methyltransferase